MIADFFGISIVIIAGVYLLYSGLSTLTQPHNWATNSTIPEARRTAIFGAFAIIVALAQIIT